MRKLETLSYSGIKKPPIQRKWYKCPMCGKNAAIYDNAASCTGVFLKCKKCNHEFEIKI